MPNINPFEHLSGDWNTDVGGISDKLSEKRKDFVTLGARGALKLRRDMVRSDVENEIDDALTDSNHNFVFDDLASLPDFERTIKEGQTLSEILSSYFRMALKENDYPSDVNTASKKSGFVSRQVRLTLYYLEKEGTREDGESFNVDRIFAGSKLSIVGGKISVERRGEKTINEVPLRPTGGMRRASPKEAKPAPRPARREGTPPVRREEPPVRPPIRPEAPKPEPPVRETPKTRPEPPRSPEKEKSAGGAIVIPGPEND